MPVSPGEARLRRRLAANVRAARRRLGLTQEQAAERAGYDVRQWQKIEAAHIGATLDTLARLALALETTAAALLA